jgi:hypothetical protein
MAAIFERAAQWRDNKHAFEAALADLQETAAAVGLALNYAEDGSEGWPQVLHAEVRPSGSGRVLARLDVGLSKQGLMLFQTSPGEARIFSSFRARDRAFYIRRFCGLIESALQASGPWRARLARSDGEAESRAGPSARGWDASASTRRNQLGA